MARGWMQVPFCRQHQQIGQKTEAVWETMLSGAAGWRDLSLLRLDEIPADLREVAITSGYRPPRCSPRQCLFSAFAATNETLNIWTHLLPSLYFFWRLVEAWRGLAVPSDPYVWAFAVYMLTACLYPLASAMAHTFYAMSDLARDVCFFLDYAALSLYSFGAGLLYRAYVFPEELLGGRFAEVFLYVCAVNAALCTLMACASRFVDGPTVVKVLRLGAFVLPWLWDSLPLVYRLAASAEGAPQALGYVRHFVFSLLIGFFYASHLPERLAPGRFDIVGHSHQMLHVCGVLATREQMNAALQDLLLRRRDPARAQMRGRTAAFWCLNGAACVLLVNLVIVGLFSLASRRRRRRLPQKKRG